MSGMTSGDEILYFVAIKPEPEYEELFNRW